MLIRDISSLLSTVERDLSIASGIFLDSWYCLVVLRRYTWSGDDSFFRFSADLKAYDILRGAIFS